jgi:hypothetical protein
MLRDVYYRDPETGKVSLHSMYEISANESISKWPKEYSYKPFKGVDPAEVKDERPPMPTLKDFKDEGSSGPPVEDRKET